LQALEQANEIRLARSRLRHELHGLGPYRAPARLAQLLEDPPGWLAGEPVGRLLLRLPKWGRRRMLRLLAHHRVGELRTVGELTVRQRHALAADLRGEGVAR
jgi:hypothetical protein